MRWRQCPLCDRDDSILKAKEWGFHIVKCRHCGLVYVNPILSEEELRDFYASGALPQQSGFELDDSWLRGYALERKKYFAAVDSCQNTASRLAKYSRILAVLKTLKPSGDPLDVGCGGGDFMSVAKSLGYETCGVEVSVSKVKRAREQGLLVYPGMLQDMNFDGREFDVVVLHHVLEHLESPVRELTKIHSLLKEDGILVIAVANVNYLLIKSRFLCNSLGRVVGPKLGMEYAGCWSPEQHLVNYSPQTLTRMLKRTGFELRLVMNEDAGLTGLPRDHLVRAFSFLARLISVLTLSHVNVNLSFVAFAGKLSHQESATIAASQV